MVGDVRRTLVLGFAGIVLVTAIHTGVALGDTGAGSGGEEPQAKAERKPAFDVLSVKHDGSLVPGRIPRMAYYGGRLNYNAALGNLIREAYHLRIWQYSAPFWVEMEYYDVQAITPRGTSPATCRLMLQSALEQRLGLKYHFADKEMNVYELVVLKDGLKLPPATKPTLGEGIKMSRFAFHRDSATLADLADFLTYNVDHPVFDRTGVTGPLRIDLDWSEEAQSARMMRDSQGGTIVDPGIIMAALKRVGLKLKPQKRAVKVFVLDHVNREPTPN